MRIGVNLIPLVPGRVGGVKQHVFGLLDSLQTQDETDSYVYYVNRGLSKILPQGNERIRVVEVPWDSDEIARRGCYGEYDVLYAPLMDLGMKTAAVPAVSLLVDLQHNAYPEFFSEPEIMARRLRWEWSARASQFVCASTEFVAGSIVNDLGIDRSRIVLTPPSLPASFVRSPDREVEGSFTKSLGKRLPDKYIFYPANTWRHKNHIRLLEALHKIRANGEDHSLVLTGWPSEAHAEVNRTIRRLGLKKHIVWVGYVSDDWMPFLYKNARALVFPSLYEGFGIPLLEAMQSDCPIVCSNVTSCPEVAGEAALYFDPTSVDDIASTIQEVTRTPAVRDRLVEAGRARVDDFSSEQAGRNLKNALRSAVAAYENPLRWQWPVPGKGHAVEPKVNEKAQALVSIIVPSFQQGRFIGATLDSILAQGYPSVEVIVIDGGSTDETVEVLKRYGDQIQWVSEPDKGQADALNKGLERAKGAIIGWLNSDDTYLPQAIEKAVHALGKRSGCWLVYGEGVYIDENGNRTGRYLTESFSEENLLKHCVICQPTVFFDRRLFERAGGADEQFDMALDYEMWLRYSKVTHFLYVPDELACSRMYAENKTSLYRLRSIRESMRACRTHYRRTSLLWCQQFARAYAEQIPIFGRHRMLRLPFQALSLAYAYLRNEVPYQAFLLARSMYRALK